MLSRRKTKLPAYQHRGRHTWWTGWASSSEALWRWCRALVVQGAPDFQHLRCPKLWRQRLGQILRQAEFWKLWPKFCRNIIRDHTRWSPVRNLQRVIGETNKWSNIRVFRSKLHIMWIIFIFTRCCNVEIF